MWNPTTTQHTSILPSPKKLTPSLASATLMLLCLFPLTLHIGAQWCCHSACKIVSLLITAVVHDELSCDRLGVTHRNACPQPRRALPSDDRARDIHRSSPLSPPFVSLECITNAMPRLLASHRSISVQRVPYLPVPTFSSVPLGTQSSALVSLLRSWGHNTQNLAPAFP